jgi:hypothetical protein
MHTEIWCGNFLENDHWEDWQDNIKMGLRKISCGNGLGLSPAVGFGISDAELLGSIWHCLF